MEIHFVLLTLGGLLLVGLATNELGRRTRLPGVTLLVLFGLAIGPSGLDLLPIQVEAWFPLIANLALVMVAFLLGGQLSRETMAAHGREILIVSVAVGLVSAFLIGGGLAVLGAPAVLALLLAGIGLATDPAATQVAAREIGAEGPLTTTVLGVVAIDDPWGLILFSLLLGVASTLNGGGGLEVLLHSGWEILGAVAIGALVGLPAAFLTGRIRPGEPSQAEALGVVFLCGGLALWLGVSFLLAGVVAGALVANLASHHTRPFHEIEHIEWPFMVLFFVLAGASLELEALPEIGLYGAAYMVLRLAGRIAGGWLGGWLAGVPGERRLLIGPALTPQAGVALGMALVAGNAVPELAEPILAIAIGSTVVFELIGPVLTQWCLRQAGEAHARPPDPEDD